LIEQIPLYDLQALLRHDRKLAVTDCFIERQLGGDHLFDVAAKRILIPLREHNRTADLLSVISISCHLGEFLALRFDSAEILIDPHNDVSFSRRLGKLMEAVQGVKLRIPGEGERYSGVKPNRIPG